MEKGESFYNTIDNADIDSEKAAAERLLRNYYGHMSEKPGHGFSEEDMNAVLTYSPLLKIAELSLLHIRDKGGRIDPILIGMLSNAAKLEDILHNTDPSPETKLVPTHQDSATLISELADEITMSGLVALPVISRGRISGRDPRKQPSR